MPSGYGYQSAAKPARARTGSTLKQFFGAIIGIAALLTVCAGLYLYEFQGVLISDADVRQSVVNGGFKDVYIEKRHDAFLSWYGCSGYDAAFITWGTNTQGQRVKVTVCAYWPYRGAKLLY